jgi:hypothetical protein
MRFPSGGMAVDDLVEKRLAESYLSDHVDGERIPVASV